LQKAQIPGIIRANATVVNALIWVGGGAPLAATRLCPVDARVKAAKVSGANRGTL
jgi:hypothetical protein